MAAVGLAGRKTAGACRDAALAHGLMVPCKVRTTITVDHLIVDLSGGCEIDLFLLGIHPPESGEPTEFGWRLNPVAIQTREWVANLVAEHSHRGVAFIPLPKYDRGWIHNLRPGSRHAGVLYLGDGSVNLNASIAAASLCSVDRECPYLSHDFGACPESGKNPSTRRAA